MIYRTRLRQLLCTLASRPGHSGLRPPGAEIDCGRRSQQKKKAVCLSLLQQLQLPVQYWPSVPESGSRQSALGSDGSRQAAAAAGSRHSAAPLCEISRIFSPVFCGGFAKISRASRNQSSLFAPAFFLSDISLVSERTTNERQTHHQ